MKRIAIFALTALMVWLASCASPAPTTIADVNPAGWERWRSVSATWTNTDTTTLHDLTLVVGYDNTVSLDGVAIRVTTLTPDSLALTETVRVRFDRTNLDNRRFFESRTPYRTAVRFMRKGEYHFSFVPETSLRGVKSVGFAIDPHEGYGKR